MPSLTLVLSMLPFLTATLFGGYRLFGSHPLAPARGQGPVSDQTTPVPLQPVQPGSWVQVLALPPCSPPEPCPSYTLTLTGAARSTLLVRTACSYGTPETILELTVNERLQERWRAGPSTIIRERILPLSGPDGATTVILSNVGPGPWKGRLLLLPPGPSLPSSPAWLLGSAFLFLLAVASRRTGTFHRYAPLLTAAVTFVLATLFQFPQRLLPLDNHLFSDSLEVIEPLLTGELTFDMSKHLLFLPILSPLVRFVRWFGAEDLLALASVFSLVAAAAGLTGHLLFRTVLGGASMGEWLAAAYPCTFAFIGYASSYETYPFSTLLFNLTALAAWRYWLLPRRGNLALLLLSSIATALAHPPLLMLVAVSALLCFHRTRRPWWQRVGLGGATVFLGLALFLAGNLAIRAWYRPMAQLGLGAEAERLLSVVEGYASTANLTLANLDRVVTAQFLVALAGGPFGTSRIGLRGFLYDPFAALWLVLTLHLLGRGMVVTLRRMQTLGLAPLFLLMGYFCFYWYFNPTEMLLYSLPLVAPLLLWLGWTLLEATSPWRLLLAVQLGFTVLVNLRSGGA